MYSTVNEIAISRLLSDCYYCCENLQQIKPPIIRLVLYPKALHLSYMNSVYHIKNITARYQVILTKLKTIK